MRNSQAGVTLIELMIVVVIVGILASIAVPSYRSYLLRTNRSDAKSALLQVQANQEKFYLQNNAYTDNITGDPPAGLGMTKVTTHGHYTIRVELEDGGQAYEAFADTNDSQEDDKKCGNFSIDEAGKREADGTLTAAECWK